MMTFDHHTNKSLVHSVLTYSRKGSRLGHDSLVDGMLKDGLWDVYNDVGMGVCAELCAEHHSITREQQVCLCYFVSKNLYYPKFVFALSF